MTTTDTRCARGCCASQAEHYRNVRLGTGDLNPQVADINRREKALHEDRSAYKRLRQDGIQPRQVDGSKHLEANLVDQVQIDYQIPIKAKDLPRVKEIQAEVAMNAWARGING